jgi:hypothetical protein
MYINFQSEYLSDLRVNGRCIKCMFKKLNMVSGGKRDKFANTWKLFCEVTL